MTQSRFLARRKVENASALCMAVIAPGLANATPPNIVWLPPPMCSLDIPCDPDPVPWE